MDKHPNMDKKTLELFDSIFKTNKKYNNSNIKAQIDLLKEFDEFFPLNESFSIMTNTTTQNHPFVSKNFEYSLGLDRQKMETEGIPYWFSHIHPEDLKVWMKVLDELMEFTMSKVEKEDRDKLTYTWNYRVKNSKGEYLNLLEHQTPTYFDEFGKPVIAISHATVVGKEENRPIIGMVKKLNLNKQYETLFEKNYSDKIAHSENISTREKEVIRLLMLNYTSKQIGEKLFISPHTVDGHRRNILKKLKFSTTSELIQHVLFNKNY